MKRKRKVKTARYRVDFVTALTADECRDYLLCKDLEGSSYTQQAYVGETGYISIERTVNPIPISRREKTVTIQFRGHLEPISNGTHVSGEITEKTLQTLSSHRGLFFLAAIGSLSIWVLAILTQPVWTVMLILILLGGALAVLYGRYYVIYCDTVLLIKWVEKQLHV